MVAGIVYFARHPAILCILCVLQKSDVRAENIYELSYDRFGVSAQPLVQQSDKRTYLRSTSPHPHHKQSKVLRFTRPRGHSWGGGGLAASWTESEIGFSSTFVPSLLLHQVSLSSCPNQILWPSSNQSGPVIPYRQPVFCGQVQDWTQL